MDEFPFYEKNLAIESSTAMVQKPAETIKVEISNESDRRRVVSKNDAVQEVKKIKVEPKKSAVKKLETKMELKKLDKKKKIINIFSDNSSDESVGLNLDVIKDHRGHRKSRSPPSRRSDSRSTRRSSSRPRSRSPRPDGRRPVSKKRTRQDEYRRSRSPYDAKKSRLPYRHERESDRHFGSKSSAGSQPPTARFYRRAQQAMVAKRRTEKSVPEPRGDEHRWKESQATMAAIKQSGIHAVVRAQREQEAKDKELRELGIHETSDSIAVKPRPPPSLASEAVAGQAQNLNNSALNPSQFEAKNMEIVGGLEELDDDEPIGKYGKYSA